MISITKKKDITSKILFHFNLLISTSDSIYIYI